MADPARDDEVKRPAEFGPQIPVKGGRDLTQAVLTAVALVVLMIVCYALGPDFFLWLAVAVVLLAMYELFAAARIAGHRPAMWFALPCTLALLLAAYFQPARPEFLVAVLGAAVTGVLLISLRSGRSTSPASDAAWTVLGIAWLGGGGAGAVSMLTLEDGVNLLVAHVLITALDDIAAYFVGTRFGRHKLAPSISPSKSWEGFFGGAVIALAGGAVFGALLDPLGVAHGVAIGAIIAVFAPAGDLCESRVKRELGIKDSGRLLPGHGGFLDRLDAIVFGALPVLAYLRIVVF